MCIWREALEAAVLQCNGATSWGIFGEQSDYRWSWHWYTFNFFSSSIFSIFWCKNSQIQIPVWSNFLLFICLQRKQRCERCRPLLRTHSAIELFSSFYIWQMGRVVFGEGLGRNLMKLLIQRLPRQLLFPPRLNWSRCQIKLQMQSFQILSFCQPSEIE